jgi:hypothetical protein
LERTQLANAVPDEFGGNVGFEVIKFVVHGLERNCDLVLMSLIGMMDGGGGLENDFEHESQEAGEEEFSFVLYFGGIIEELVELVGRKEALKGGTDEDGKGGLFFKAFEQGGVRVHGDSFQKAGTMKGNVTIS